MMMIQKRIKYISSQSSGTLFLIAFMLIISFVVLSSNECYKTKKEASEESETEKHFILSKIMMIHYTEFLFKGFIDCIILHLILNNYIY